MSENLKTNLKSEPIQIPLKGFRVPAKSDADGWNKMVEGMGGQRLRLHFTKIKK